MRQLRIITAAIAAILFIDSWAAAQGAAETLAKTVKVDIGPQKVSTALIEFSHQAGIQVLMPGELVEALESNGARGEMTVGEAMSQLLKGTNLGFREVGKDAIGIELRAAAAGLIEPTATTDGSLHLAQADAPQNPGAATTDQPLEKLEEIVINIPEILVTGSRSLNMDIQRTRDDIQPYVVFSHETLERSGARNIEDFLQRRLPQSTNSQTSLQSTPQLTSLTGSSINLRGLGADQTLILIDGHRVSGAVVQGALTQPNLNGIPLAAVERIEVLPTTASGIYGGGATGGVINVVLRRDYSGVDTKLTYGGSFEGGAAHRQIDASSGFNFESGKTNLLLAGSYSTTNPLLVGDRDFARQARAKVLRNDPLALFASPFAIPLGSTTNIAGFDPNTFSVVDLTLKGTHEPLGSPFTFVPAGYAGIATDADGGAAFVENAGGYNLFLANTTQLGQGRRAQLLANPESKSLNLTLRREFTPNLQAFLEAGGVDNSVRGTANLAFGNFFIPSTAPNNPFEQDIQVQTATLGADRRYEAIDTTRRAVAGVIVKLPRKWQAEADHSWSRARNEYSDVGQLNGDGSAAVADGTLDVLKDTNLFPVDFSPFVGEPLTHLTPTSATMRDSTLRFAGPVGSLPAGAPSLSLLLEHRKESFGDTTNISPDFGSQLYPATWQSVDSIYLEAKVPLIAAANSVPAVHSLELQVAGRRDRYKIHSAGAVNLDTDLQPLTPPVYFDNTLTSTNPTVGLRYQPVPDITLRGSYAKGFLPPAVNQLTASALLTLPIALFPYTDTRRGGQPFTDLPGDVVLAGGGSSDLQPERSKSWAAGVILTPRFVPNLRMSVDWTKTEKTDNITILPFIQESVDLEEAVPGLVVRGPVDPTNPVDQQFNLGPIVRFNAILRNIARANFEAYDFALDYRWPTARFGSIDLALVATHLTHVETQLVPGGEVVENVGVAKAQVSDRTVGGGLKWKGNSTLTWQYKDWSAGWTARFFDSYWLNLAHEVDLTQGSATIPSQMYHDVFVTWMPSSSSVPAFLANTEIQLNIQNVLNKSPPLDFSDGFGGLNGLFYSQWGDPRLASYWLSIRKSFR